MKKLILSSTLLAVIGVVGATGTTAFAEEVKNQNKTSDVSVSIEDNSTDPSDPLDPTDPNQKLLNLVSVPTSYDFTSSLKNGSYELSTSLSDQSIKVFNDRSTRLWSVKASITDNKLTSAGSDFTVTSFKVNDNELVGPSSSPIVAKNGALTTDGNTGTISTAVNNASISFSDPEGKLKAGSKLTGTIAYQLYNTSTAE